MARADTSVHSAVLGCGEGFPVRGNERGYEMELVAQIRQRGREPARTLPGGWPWWVRQAKQETGQQTAAKDSGWMGTV